MQLVTFERLLIERLQTSGRVKSAQSFGDAGFGLLYGVVVDGPGGRAAIHLTRGSGTGDPKATEVEQAEHEARVAALKPSSRHAAVQAPAVDALVREVLQGAALPGAVSVVGAPEGREESGVKVRFETGLEIYAKPVSG